MTQQEKILEHLIDGSPLTRIVAIQQLHVYNLPARIKELRDDGWPIDREDRVDLNGQRFAEYRLQMSS